MTNPQIDSGGWHHFIQVSFFQIMKKKSSTQIATLHHPFTIRAEQHTLGILSGVFHYQ